MRDVVRLYNVGDVGDEGGVELLWRDGSHVEAMAEELGLSECKTVRTPEVKCDTKQVDDENLLSPDVHAGSGQR